VATCKRFYPVSFTDYAEGADPADWGCRLWGGKKERKGKEEKRVAMPNRNGLRPLRLCHKRRGRREGKWEAKVQPTFNPLIIHCAID